MKFISRQFSGASVLRVPGRPLPAFGLLPPRPGGEQEGQRRVPVQADPKAGGGAQADGEDIPAD